MKPAIVLAEWSRHEKAIKRLTSRARKSRKSLVMVMAEKQRRGLKARVLENNPQSSYFASVLLVSKSIELALGTVGLVSDILIS